MKMIWSNETKPHLKNIIGRLMINHWYINYDERIKISSFIRQLMQCEASTTNCKLLQTTEFIHRCMRRSTSWYWSATTRTEQILLFHEDFEYDKLAKSCLLATPRNLHRSSSGVLFAQKPKSKDIGISRNSGSDPFILSNFLYFSEDHNYHSLLSWKFR